MICGNGRVAHILVIEMNLGAPRAGFCTWGLTSTFYPFIGSARECVPDTAIANMDDKHKTVVTGCSLRRKHFVTAEQFKFHIICDVLPPELTSISDGSC
jgi:hypothetical protein